MWSKKNIIFTNYPILDSTNKQQLQTNQDISTGDRLAKHVPATTNLSKIGRVDKTEPE